MKRSYLWFGITLACIFMSILITGIMLVSVYADFELCLYAAGSYTMLFAVHHTWKNVTLEEFILENKNYDTVERAVELVNQNIEDGQPQPANNP